MYGTELLPEKQEKNQIQYTQKVAFQDLTPSDDPK